MPKTGPHADFAYRLEIAAASYKRTHRRPLDREALADAVAEEAGKGGSKATASAWFNGHQLPSVLQVAALARYLGVEPGWLAFGEPDYSHLPPMVAPSHPITHDLPKRPVPSPAEREAAVAQGNRRKRSG